MSWCLEVHIWQRAVYIYIYIPGYFCIHIKVNTMNNEPLGITVAWVPLLWSLKSCVITYPYYGFLFLISIFKFLQEFFLRIINKLTQARNPFRLFDRKQTLRRDTCMSAENQPSCPWAEEEMVGMERTVEEIVSSSLIRSLFPAG